MLFFEKLVCCSKEIRSAELWILKDFNGFVQRKLLKAVCPLCGDDVCLLIQKSTKNGNTYLNNYTHLEAVKALYREKKRIAAQVPAIATDNLYGWIYGVNVQIRNRKGVVSQLRQYSSDFHGNRTLVKKILN